MRPRLLAIALLTGLCTGLSAPVFAQMKSMVARTGHWEGSVGLYGTSSESASGTNGSGIDVDGGIGLSLGLGYHFSEHLAVRFDGSWARPDYSARFNTEEDGGGHGRVAIQQCLEKRPNAFQVKPKEVGMGCTCKNYRCKLSI